MAANNSKDRERHVKGETLGLTHVLYGDGVGKTTAAVGLTIRAAAAGLDVHFVQFMKPDDSGEVGILREIPNILYRCPGAHPFITNGQVKKVHLEHAQKALEYAWEAARGQAQVLICDELLNTILFGILTTKQVLELMAGCRNKVELVMTGRTAPEDIVQAADYVIEFIKKKHPYDSGVEARLGIEK